VYYGIVGYIEPVLENHSQTLGAANPTIKYHFVSTQPCMSKLAISTRCEAAGKTLLFLQSEGTNARMSTISLTLAKTQPRLIPLSCLDGKLREKFERRSYGVNARALATIGEMSDRATLEEVVME
jgi:hypothetical protein